MNIYVDMDDVVADWFGYAREYLNEPLFKDGDILPDATWQKLKDDQRMYSKLPVKEGAYQLINWLTAYATEHACGLYFLTAIPKGNDMPWAPTDKIFWANKYFPQVPVFLGPYSFDKWVRCQPGDILIDDRKSNCEDWRRAGGRAHMYRSWEECKPWLEETLGV